LLRHLFCLVDRAKDRPVFEANPDAAHLGGCAADFFAGEARGATFAHQHLEGMADRCTAVKIVGASPGISRSRHVSDSDDDGFPASGRRERLYVVHVACENHSLVAPSHRHHNGVNDIRHSGCQEARSIRGSRRSELSSNAVAGFIYFFRAAPPTRRPPPIQPAAGVPRAPPWSSRPKHSIHPGRRRPRGRFRERQGLS